MGEAATAPPVPKRHCCEPSCSATAYTLWSSEPKYATPSLRAGVDHTLSPVVKRQRWEPSSASSAYRLPSDVPTTTRPSATAGAAHHGVAQRLHPLVAPVQRYGVEHAVVAAHVERVAVQHGRAVDGAVPLLAVEREPPPGRAVLDVDGPNLPSDVPM